MRVIAYGSRALSPAQKNYHLNAGKLEFLALKWAVTDHFRDYLYYSPKFTVFTDNNALTYILTSAKLNATGLRWVNELADFNFEIRYRPGKLNADADTLSRMPVSFEDYKQSCSEVVSQNVLDAISSSIQETKLNLKTQLLLVFYTFCKLEDDPPFEINRRSQLSCDSSYTNGITCSLLKREFFITSLDLGIEWCCPRNNTKGCTLNCMKTWDI